MDDRIREHATTLVDWSARIEPGDHVVIEMGPAAHELGVAVAAELGDRGASYQTNYFSGEIDRAYLLASNGDVPEPTPKRVQYEAADAILFLGGGRNRSDMAEVPADRERANRLARKSLREARFGTRWVKTLHPTRSLAQAAGLSTAAYRDFAYGAINRDWESLADEMAGLQSILDSGSEVRLVSEGTDLTMSIAGRTAVNSAASVAYGSHNLPSGEVFTAPLETTGTVTFDIPMTIRGRSVRDVRLTFEDGEVTDVAAVAGTDVIQEVIETDSGARRLGELGIGMNRGIDRVTNSILFDEKMGGTVHLALGRAYDACIPAGTEGNDSAVHVDLLCDMRRESRLEVDGNVIQRNGVFRWEDEFDG